LSAEFDCNVALTNSNKSTINQKSYFTDDNSNLTKKISENPTTTSLQANKFYAELMQTIRVIMFHSNGAMTHEAKFKQNSAMIKTE